MASELELDSRHKILPFKVRAASKESQPHKAAHVLDLDPKSHWSTSTNSKEWLLLELEEPCLLQQIRIHNKSVLEWEISLGLRYKPDLFAKVRTRCEAPRRESQYIVNYAPCRYVRLSCLRGNPIAIYSVQLIGFSMPGLEPEFQPLVDHLLPRVISTKHELQDMYLQLLGEIITRLSPFITYLEGDLASYNENVESSLRFLATLSGPFYPILFAIDERERSKNLATATDTDCSKGAQGALFTVSSNFQAPPRRSRSPTPFQQPAGQLIAFRPDVVLMLFRVAYRDHTLGTVCRMVSRVFSRIAPENHPLGVAGVHNDAAPGSYHAGLCSENVLSVSTAEVSNYSTHQTDYSAIFGENFSILEVDGGELGLSALLDTAIVEEGLLHFLYASVSKTPLCRRLAEATPDLVPVLPYIQAVLPAIRPGSGAVFDQLDESFMPWQEPLVELVCVQIVSLATTPSYRPLLDACAGYLASFSIIHEKAACILIDLCFGRLAPWMPVVIAKVDLAFELVEGILNSFEVVDNGVDYAHAAFIYVVLGLSGHMDESLTLYKAVKHNIIFVIQILEAFLLPAITPIQTTIAFGDVSAMPTKKQERNCSLALDILRAAMTKPEVLPALEFEWRRGVVKPSVLVLALAPHLPLLDGLDAQNSMSEAVEDSSSLQGMADGHSKKVTCENKTKTSAPDDDATLKIDPLVTGAQDFGHFGVKGDTKLSGVSGKDAELYNLYNREEFEMLQLDSQKVYNHQERELWAADFISFAERLHSQRDEDLASHDAAIDCLLLAAECHLNPFMPWPWEQKRMERASDHEQNDPQLTSMVEGKLIGRKELSVELGLRGLLDLEEERDKVVLQILLKAAEWDAHARVTDYEGLHESQALTIDDKMYSENGAIDATTLLRQHQFLFLRFLILHLERRCDYMYEALLQGLCFYLTAATELLTSSEIIVDIILMTAEQINVFVLDKAKQKGSKHSITVSMSWIQRKWAILCRLVAAASGGELIEDYELVNVDIECHKELIPASAWMSKLADFATSPFPLVRFVGWKGLARFALFQQQSGVVLASDLHQLSALLSLFADDLMCSDITGSRPESAKLIAGTLKKQPTSSSVNMMEHCNLSVRNCLNAELNCICPSLHKQFISIAFVILDAVCSQLKGLPVTAVPDVLSWFSDLCTHPFIAECSSNKRLHKFIKGFAAVNVRYIILQLLEVLLLEYMEALVPELPRVVNVVLSLCQSSYCDISLLDSVFKALNPIISYGLTRDDSVKELSDEDCDTVTIESLCFDPLLKLLEKSTEQTNILREERNDGSCLVFLSGAVLAELSFLKKIQVMHLLINWANFTTFSETTSYINYLNAFMKVFEVCKLLAEAAITQLGLAVPITGGKLQEQVSEKVAGLTAKDVEKNLDTTRGLYLKETQSQDFASQFIKSEIDETLKLPIETKGSSLPLCWPNLQEFEECVKNLTFSLAPALENVWSLHPDLTEKLVKRVTECLLASSQFSKHDIGLPDDTQDAREVRQSNVEGLNQNIGINGSAIGHAFQAVMMFQKSQYWRVAICAMEFLLLQPDSEVIVEVLPLICSILEYQCTHAPRISWREVVIKWLSRVLEVLSRHQLRAPIAPLAQLFKVFMEHMEPEQKVGALQELEKLADFKELDENSLWAGSSSMALPTHQIGFSNEAKLSVEADFVAAIVDAEWDCVCSLAACDPSPRIRKQAIGVLVKFVPFAQSHHLQRLLSSVDTFLPGLAKESYTLIDAPVTRLSLTLLSQACLYSSAKEISMIPARVWSGLEALSKPRNRSILGEAEHTTCVALLQLRDHEGDTKQSIGKPLQGTVELVQRNSQFSSVQETVLQVLARLKVARRIEDNYLAESTEEAKDLQEAEIELELIKGRRAPQENIVNRKLPSKNKSSYTVDSKSRKEQLEQLRIQILSEEAVSTRAEISARLERQKLARHNRQLALEQATLREMELLQELDREKAAEMEKDIERQRMLERERARTKEIRHSLELEAERRTQRDLQRELEQRESGTVRPSRREFPGSVVLVRDIGRGKVDDQARMPDPARGSHEKTAPHHQPHQLQDHDQVDDRGFDDFVDGPDQSSEGAGFGDADGGAGLEAVVNSGASLRQSSRPFRSRQIIERRERESKREGKWERKQN